MISFRKSTPTARDICRVLFRHKKKAGGVFLLTMTAVAAGIAFCPRTYQSEAKLFVRMGRESVTLDPTATTGQTVSVYESRENEINSVLDILQSRAMVEKVVDALGPDVILGRRGAAADGSLLAAADAVLPNSIEALQQIDEITRIDKIGDREKAVQALEHQLAIYGGRKSSVISVACEARSPQLAQRITQVFLDVCRSEHVRLNRTAGSHEFFEEQVRLSKQKLNRASEQLRDVKNELGLVSIEGQRKLLEDEMGRIRGELLRAGSGLSAVEARVAAIRELLAQTPAEMVTQETAGLPNVAGDGMRGELYRLEVHEKELSSKFQDGYPLLIAVREQLQDAKAVVDRQDPSRTQATTTPNPVYQQLQASLVTEESNAAALRGEKTKLDAQHMAIVAQLKTLNGNEVRIAELQRQVDLADQSYREYADKLEQGRVGEALEAERITNVNVVQKPTFQAKPVSPKKQLALALGLFVAVLGSLGAALMAEYLDHSFKTPAEVEETLDLPVLLSVPKVSRRQVQLN